MALYYYIELRTDAPCLWTWKRLMEKTVEIVKMKHIEVNYDGEVYHYSAAEDVIPDDNGYLKIVLSGGGYVRFPLRYVVDYSVDGIRKAC